MNTLGIRHLALNVRDPQVSKEFYTRVLKMQVEWEPDTQNVYLTSGGHDNLALHQAPADGSGAHSSAQALDHMGFAVPAFQDVDDWHSWVTSQKVNILRDLKTHRDGARSFYFADPDGVVIQIICHPPISKRASAPA